MLAQKEFYCPIKNSQCSIKTSYSPDISCFIAVPYREELLDTRNSLIKILEEYNIRPYFADEDISAGRDILCKICENIMLADFGVIELTAVNNNVLLEFGMILGKNKPVFVLFDKSRSESSHIPSDIIAIERIEYKNQLSLKNKFEKGIKKYISSIDIRERELESLYKLSLIAMQNNDFQSLNSYLNLLYVRYDIYYGGNGIFFEILEKLLSLLKNQFNIREYIKYSILIMRLYIIQGKTDKSLEYFDELFNVMSNRIKYIKNNLDVYIDPKISKDLEGWYEWDYMGFYHTLDKDFFNNLDEFFAYSIYNFEKSNNKETWIEFLLHLIRLSLTGYYSELDWISEKKLPLDDYDDYRYLNMVLLYTISILYTDDRSLQKRVTEEWKKIRKKYEKIVIGYLD